MRRVETQRILVAVQLGRRRRVRIQRLLPAVQPEPRPDADRERSSHHRPRRRDPRDRSHLGARYALVVSIEAQGVEADIWTPVAQQIGVPIEMVS
jgi:hypothetical protein